MSEKSRQFLHGEFVKAGLNVGTAEEFDSLMVNNAESRNWAKAQAERLGFDTTDFDRKMTEVTITPINENVAVSDTTKPTDTPAQILARTKEKATSNNGGKVMAMPVANLDQWKQEADIKARQAVEDGKASAVQYVDYQPISWEEMQQSTNPYVQKIVREHDRRNKSKTFKIGFNPINKGIFNIDEDVNHLTGEKYYYDKLGFEHDNIFSALDANDRYQVLDRQAHYKRDYINSLDQRIADTENKIKEVQAEQAKKTSNVNKGASAFMPASARTITETQTAEQLAPQETEELKQLQATLKDLHDMKTTVQAQNELTKSDGFFDWNNAKNIWRGLSDTFTDPYFYSSFLSSGLTDLTDAQAKAKVFDKIEKGQELTGTEMQLALASGMADDIKSSADLPIGYTGAKIAGESLPFILQMALNPATGLAKGAAKAVARKVGRSGLWAVTARVGARALGATAEAAVLANTIQAGATAADIIDRKTGKVKLGFDENGYLIPTEIDDKKSWGQAIYEGEASKIIENATELMGLPDMSKLTKATAKGLEKLGLKNVRKTINTLSRSKMSQFLERAGWHGPLGEIFEEEAGMFFNIVAQVGDNKWSDFYDIKKQSEIALGCSLFGGVVSVYTTTSAATSLALDAKAERRIKSTDAIAKGRLTESRWLPIKEEFDNALDSEREEMVGRIMSDTKFTPQEKKAVLDYFSAAVYWEGRNQAKAITALESKPTPTQRAINATEEAYQQGMLADNSSDQYDAMEQLRTAEQKVRDFFGWDESVDVDDEIKTYFGTSETSELLNQLQDYNEDVQDLFADYLFARTKYDGMMQGQQQRVDAGATELEERLNAEAHSARQEMVSATLADGSSCTIIGGNFEIKDGVIDLANSDQAIVIMQDGKKRMITADQVGNVTTMPIEQVINEQVTAYRQQADTEFENGINLVAQSRQQAEAAEQQGTQAEQAEQPTATEEAEQPQEQQPSIPVDAKGNPLYEQATPELVVQDIYENQGLPVDIATQFVDNKLEEAKKIAEKLAKKEPKIGTNIAQYKEAMVQWQQATTEAQSNIAFWEEVKAVASQRNQPTEETAPTTEETVPVVEVEEQAEETTEAEQPTEEDAKEVTLETEEVVEEQTPIAENTQSVAETQAETTEEQSAEEETAPETEQTTEEEVAEETPTEEQPQAEQTEEVTEEYIGQVVNSLAEAYDSFVNEAQKEVTNNLDSFKTEVASRTDEEIATAIADIESTPILGKLFERIRNGLLSGEIKRTEQEEQDLINALQRIAQGNVAKNMLLPIFKAEQQKRAEQQAESKTEPQPKAKAKPKATPKATPKTTAKAKTPKRKKEVNFFKYILPKKERELRPVLAGVFMRDGYRVASDTHILIAERAEYSPALEGRVINEDGIALVDMKGNPIINNLAWQRVIPTPENSSLVLTPIESIMAMLEQAKPLNKIFADDAPYNGNTATEIEIETENGPAFFDSAKLALFMDFVLTIDNPTLAYGNNTRSIWVTSADGSKKAVLMGLASESDRVEAIRISTRKGIEVGADFSYNNKKTNELKSELKESEDYIALMKAQPVPPRRELSFHEKKVAQLKALIAIREGKTDLADAAEDARRKPLRQRAKEWEQKTGTKVVIVEDETEIEQESARRQVAESKVMGWYNRKSGEVYLYMPNLMSEEDIDNTFIHEVVIHKGLRGLLKPQAYNSVMQRVFDSLSPEQQAKWLNYPGVKGDAIKAADEYIANTFESIEVENPSLWQKFVDAIRTALINMGINLKVSDATLGSLIRQSYHKMAEQKAMEIPTEMIEVANEIPADASAETSFSIKIASALNEKSMEYAKQKEVSEEFINILRKAEADINQMAERISQDLGGDLDAKRRGKRMLPEEVNVQDGKPLKGYSTIFKNGSYGRTMENTLKCLRTLAYIDFVNDVKERIGRPLTSQESFLASQMLYDISVDPQCLYCYVSLDRKAYDEFLIRYLNQRDAVITAYDSLSAKDKKNPKVIDELYQDFLASRKDTKEMKRRFNMWIDARKAGLPLLNAADVATTTRRDNIRNNGDASLKAQLKDAEAYAQGASWAKKEDEYRAYTGEILRLPQSTVNTLNKEYGLRFYSFSEYSPAFIVENMQMIRDAAIRGLRGLAYTKETDFVKIFAPSQININVSVFGRRDANGNMVADTRQGADWAEAKALREQYPNVGAVFVATNDADVEWALAQDWIDVVIPFHIVRTGADIANFYEWVNYSSEQADKDVKGRKADISPVEHLNSKERYMQLVEERNLTPRFAKWSDNPNYMKLVNETRRPYNQTPTLTPSFMLNEALTSWSEFNEKGGYYGGWYNVDEQGYQDAVAQVTADIQEGRTAKDVDYGRQDVPADAWNTKRQTREQRVHHNAPLTNASEITQEESANDEDIAFSVRESAPPKKTQKAYAVFVVNKHKDGKVSLHPKMISGDAVGAPPLTWLNADTGKAKRDKDGNIILNTLGRAQVNAAGGLAWRPGKHLAPYPNSSQFKVKGDTKGVRDRTPDNIIYFEVEYAADNDYQIPAWEYGVNKNGIYQHTQAGLPYIPEDGYYVYRTNANPDIPPMIITGAYRITRALTDAEAKELNQKAGGEWFPRKSGNPVTEETLKELGLDEKGLQQMADDFDFTKLSAHYDESNEVRNLPGYVRRTLNFADTNLQSAIAENTKAMPEFPSAEEWKQAYVPSEDIAFSVADDAADTADTFTSAAEAIAQQLGVEIEIDESIPAKGSYNPRTGRIRINPSRHATAEDVQRTVLHETIGHGGVQAVAGKRFGQVCQQVYDMMSEEQRADIRSRHGNLSDEAVGAEYMAEMAEKGKVDITTWEKVKAMVRNMLMSMGINLNLTDADIRYMLYSAHQLAEKGKLQDAINRATTLGKLRRQAELSHDVAEDAMSRPLMRPIDPDLIELTTGELGLTDVQVIDADTLEKMFDSTKLAKANKHSIFTQFKNNFVDRTRPIAKFIQQVYGLKNIGEAYVWDPESNPHIGANLAPSKAMRRTQVFRQGKMKDLLDTYNNLWMEWRKANRGYGVEYAQAMARLYAIAKTAQERQAIKGKGSKDTDFAGVAGVLKWIGMTVKVHNGKFLKPINWETEASALGKDHDELTIAECEAILAQHGYPSMQEFIAEFEKGVDVKEFWNMTQAISHDMLRNQLEAGLLSPTSYQILMYGKSFVEIAKAKGVTDTNMLMSMVTMTDSQQLVDLGIITQDEADALTPYYQHYLPLKDSTDIEQTDVVDYGGNRKVEGSKRAVQSVTGHSNMVGDPIARLCYDYTVAIHNEEENKWKLQLLDIVRYHQSTTPPKKRMAVATSRKYINGIIGAFDEVRINPHAMSEHEVAVFENGSQVVIRFADKSIAEAVNPEKVKVGKFLQTLNKFNRFLANAYTSKNPAFVVPNVIRDYQAGFQYNLAKGKKQWMIYHKMMANARSRQALYDLLINREDHSAWGNTKYADYVQEFLDNGGPTAVNQMASLDNIQDELNKTAKAINEAKTPLSGLKKGARATTEWLGRMGEMAELTTRLATYIAARECGKSVSLAALEAKEVSVNFDRKGKASIRKYFPLFSIFQNAALQSLRREWGLMRETPLTYAAYRLIKPAMHVGLSIYVGMLINGIDGDDEEEVKEYLLNYFSVNSHTASANFLIPTSKGMTLSIPAAIDDMGFNKLAFLITKRVTLNSVTGQAYNAEESVMDDVIEVVSQFADMAGQNPLTVGLSTLTPSFDDMEVGERAIYAWSANPVLSPFIQTGLNRDYKGEKFYGEPIVNQGRPRNYYDWNKNSFGHSVAKLLNDATGGNDAVPGFINIQGAAIDLFLSSYLGGYGDFASKTLDTGKNAGELLFGDGKVEEYGKEKEIGLADVISDLPVAYRFAKAPIEVYGEIGVKDHVVRLKNKANEWERQIVNQYKDGYIEEAQEMLQDGNGSGSAQDYYLSIGRSKIYEWSKDIPNAKTLYEDMMSETYHNGEYSTLGQAAIIIGQAEMFSSLIKGNFDDLENPNDASYLYEDIKKYYLPTMKEILKEAEPEEVNAEIEAIAQEIVDYYNELGNPTPHTKDTKLYKEDE